MDNATRGRGRFVRERRDELGMNQGDLRINCTFVQATTP
jgi:hypothetical protein